MARTRPDRTLARRRRSQVERTDGRSALALVALVGLVLAAVAGLAGCTSGPSAVGTTASLDVDRWTGTSNVVHSSAHLDCKVDSKGSAFLARGAAHACARISAGALTATVKELSSGRPCANILTGPQRAHIDGTVNGKDVTFNVDRSNSCQTVAWAELGYLVGDPTSPARSLSAAKPGATTTTVPARGTQRYTVADGDTLASIAAQFGVTGAQIAALNALHAPTVSSGQRLQIPATGHSALLVAPGHGPVGATFTLTFVGARPGESIQFFVKGPINQNGGSPHQADADGTAIATYETTDSGDGPGAFGVEGVGNQGSFAAGTFVVDPR